MGVEVGSGGDNARGFTVGVLTTTLDSSSLAEAYWRKRHGLEDQRDDRSPEKKSRSLVSAWSTNGTGGRSTSALTSICGGIAPIDSANSVTLLLWLFFSAWLVAGELSRLTPFLGDRTGM